MVVLNKIYTRGGDDGTTALGNGERTQKSDIRVESYGTVDELNSVIGLAVHQIWKQSQQSQQSQQSTFMADWLESLKLIQNDLFDLGADLCRPIANNEADLERPPLRIKPQQVERLESEIDRMNADLNPLNSFILPGGSAVASWLHLARTVARRAERNTCLLEQKAPPINCHALQFLNRLSDWLFVAARLANDKGQNDVLWEPGKSISG